MVKLSNEITENSKQLKLFFAAVQTIRIIVPVACLNICSPKKMPPLSPLFCSAFSFLFNIDPRVKFPGNECLALRYKTGPRAILT